MRNLALSTSIVEDDMGWLFEYHGRGRVEYLKHLTDKSHFAEAYTPIKSRVVGNHVWQAVKHEPTQEVFIHLDLIAKQRKGGWGYKGMTEHMGPYYYDCPLSLLKLCTEPKDEDVKAWRAKVQKFHAAKKARPKPVPGMTVTLGDRQYELLEKLDGRSGWRVKDVATGSTYWMLAAQLSHALSTAQAPVDNSAQSRHEPLC